MMVLMMAAVLASLMPSPGRAASVTASVEMAGNDYWESDPAGVGVAWAVVPPDGGDPADWTTTCSLDDAAVSQCTAEEINRVQFAEGHHRLVVTPRHMSSGEEGTPFEWAFTRETTPPVVLPYDPTPLARPGANVSIPKLFDDAESGIDYWSCSSPDPHQYFPGSDSGIVVDPPLDADTDYKYLRCRAGNRLGMRTETTLGI